MIYYKLIVSATEIVGPINEMTSLSKMTSNQHIKL